MRKYTYDRIGNIEQVRQIGTNAFTRDYSYVTDKNILDEISIGSNTYEYDFDAVGNQTLVNSNRKFTWDSANRLLFFRNQVGSGEPTVEAQYLYDSSGNRVKKIVRKQGGGYEIRVYIDGIFEYYTDETDEQNTIHIMDDKSRIAMVRIGADMGDTTPAIKYVLENNIGSSMVMLDGTGAEVNEQEYYPFGETSFGSYAKKRYQYTGKERDEESGVYYYGARYYSPWIARFVSIDPLVAKYPNLSGYLYAYNNPIRMNDPTGMEGEEGGAGGSGNSGNSSGSGNSDKSADPSVQQNATTQKTEIHFINKDSGKYLGSTTVEDGSGGDQYRSISQEDYNSLSENNFEPVTDKIGTRSVENSSRQITVDTEKINSDLASMLEVRKDESGATVENNMVLLYDAENNTITSQVLNSTGNTNSSTNWDADLNAYSTGSVLKDNPNMHVIGEFHTHPDKPSNMAKDFGSGTKFNDSYTKTTEGMSEPDMERTNQRHTASSYAIGTYESKTNPRIFTIDKGASDHKTDSYEVATLEAVQSGTFDLVKHSILRNRLQ